MALTQPGAVSDDEHGKRCVATRGLAGAWGRRPGAILQQCLSPARDLYLDGLKVYSSSSSGRQFWLAPGSLVIPAGGYVVLCHGDTVLGSSCDYAYGTDSNPTSSQGATYSASFALGNSGAITVTVSLDGTTLDQVIYNDGSGWPSSSNGKSVGLDPTLLDAVSNDTGSNWCYATTTHGSGDYGTPALANDTCAP